MSGASGAATVAQVATPWPSASKAAVRSASFRGSEGLNTSFRRTLVYLLARTRGGQNRCRILKLLQTDGPLNANQIAGGLGLHYTTVQHHLNRLLRDSVVSASPNDGAYGALFFLTYQMERNAEFLDELLPAFERTDPKRGPNRGVAEATGAV
jgi:DNA-binding transcriptional ArsR family regulator